MAGKRGAPVGNDNATKNKPWADAIRKAVVQKKALDKIAAKLVDDAMEGDKDAWQEIGNRLDGKPHQTIAAEVDTTVTVELVRYGNGKAG
jgi:hypothetical protein